MIEERASNDFNVTVDFINKDKLPMGYQISDYELNSEKVTITSSKEIIDRIAIVKVYVDVAGLKESIKNRELPVNVYDSQGNELAVKVDPATVVISAEIENPSKKVPVSIATSGELPEGFSLVSMELVTKEVEVFAISEILETLDEVTTEPVNLSELKQSGTIKVGLVLPEKVQAPGVKELEIVVDLEQERVFDDVPIGVENLEDGYNSNFVEPSNGRLSITVTGNEQHVRELSAEDFRVFINANGLDTGRNSVPVEVEGPDNVSIDVGVEEVTIEIEEV